MHTMMTSVITSHVNNSLSI